MHKSNEKIYLTTAPIKKLLIKNLKEELEIAQIDYF